MEMDNKTENNVTIFGHQGLVQSTRSDFKTGLRKRPNIGFKWIDSDLKCSGPPRGDGCKRRDRRRLKHLDPESGRQPCKNYPLF